MTPDEIEGTIERLVALFERASADDYIGEAVSQLDHALQAAALAVDAGAADEEVIAALLHDVGHLELAPDGASMGGYGVARHEHVGADRLAVLGFGPSVTELVRAHVDAKRYLVATRADYAQRLSRASRKTLEHQGGAMTPDEAAAFEADPLLLARLRVRSWDEAAKEPDATVPAFERYVPILRAHLAAPASTASGS